VESTLDYRDLDGLTHPGAPPCQQRCSSVDAEACTDGRRTNRRSVGVAPVSRSRRAHQGHRPGEPSISRARSAKWILASERRTAQQRCCLLWLTRARSAGTMEHEATVPAALPAAFADAPDQRPRKSRARDSRADLRTDAVPLQFHPLVGCPRAAT
jgi:hypothetical protein